MNIKTASLIKALTTVGQCVSGATTLPILSQIAFRFPNTAGLVSLTATNLDQTISTTLTHDGPCIEGDGFCLPAHKLVAIARELSGEELQLTLGNTKSAGKRKEPTHAIITCGQSEFRIPFLPITEFPAIAKLDDTKSTSFTLGQARLRELLDLTGFCTSTDQSRFILQGVFFHLTPTDLNCLLTMVATDGRRLSVSDIPLLAAPRKPSPEIDFILPRDAVKQLHSLLATKADADVRVSFDTRQIQFDLAGAGDDGQPTTVTSKQIEGNFPNWKQVMPSAPLYLELDPATLLAACERVSIVGENANLDFKHQTLTIESSGSVDNGFAREEILIARVTPLKIAFRLDYIIDALQAITGLAEPPQVEVHATDGLSPILLSVPTAGWRHVIMPMRMEAAEAPAAKEETKTKKTAKEVAEPIAA